MAGFCKGICLKDDNKPEESTPASFASLRSFSENRLSVDNPPNRVFFVSVWPKQATEIMENKNNSPNM
jgi:hypothetical protein